MSYTPINQPVFLAAMSGAIAGMGASNRVPKSNVQASYAGLAAIAGAWSQSFDQAWNNASSVSQYVLDTISTASEATWEQRGPTTASVVTLDPDTYNEQTAALVAMIQASLAYLSGQGITPGGSELEGPDVVGPLDNNTIENITGQNNVTEYTVTIGADNLKFVTSVLNNYNKVIGWQSPAPTQATTNTLNILGQNLETSDGTPASNMYMVTGVREDQPTDLRYAGLFVVGSGGVPASEAGYNGAMFLVGNGAGNNIDVPDSFCRTDCKGGLGVFHDGTDSGNWFNFQNFGMGQIRISRIASTDPYADFLGMGLGCRKADDTGNVQLISISASDDLANPDMVQIGSGSNSIGFYPSGQLIKFDGTPVTPTAGAVAGYLKVQIVSTEYYIPLHLPV